MELQVARLVHGAAFHRCARPVLLHRRSQSLVPVNDDYTWRLEPAAPRARHALEEVKSDYHRIVYAEALDQAKKTYREFINTQKHLID